MVKLRKSLDDALDIIMGLFLLAWVLINILVLNLLSREGNSQTGHMM